LLKNSDEPDLPRLPEVDPTPPPTPAATSSGGLKGPRVLVAIGGAIALLLTVAAGFHLLSSDSAAGANGTPEQAVRDYFYASKAEDCDRLVDLVTKKAWSADGRVTRDKAIAMCEREAKAAPKLQARLDRVKEISRRGGTAVVKADVTVEKRHRTVSIKLAREHDAWKIAGS
jgi:hypothetical protein